ncbi:hypothetical protein Tco_0704810 [Tanacetum coccineum]|uniref:Uncharacterized protein n=1 Tax=Tanacetum coccineum TaxID=301880 RepID=A0ABQ4Y2W1_9ASTR
MKIAFQDMQYELGEVNPIHTYYNVPQQAKTKRIQAGVQEHCKSGHGNYCNFHIDDLVPTDLDDGKYFEACDFDDHLVQTDGPYFLDEEREEFKRRICHLLKLEQKKPPLLPRKDSRELVDIVKSRVGYSGSGVGRRGLILELNGKPLGKPRSLYGLPILIFFHDLVRIFRPFSKDIPSIHDAFPRTAMLPHFYVLMDTHESFRFFIFLIQDLCIFLFSLYPFTERYAQRILFMFRTGRRSLGPSAKDAWINVLVVQLKTHVTNPDPLLRCDILGVLQIGIRTKVIENQIPSPPLPIPSSPPNSPTYVKGSLRSRAARIRQRDALPYPVHETEMPEICLSLSGAARQVGSTKTRADLYGFADMLDAAPGCQTSRELGYGITDTWDDLEDEIIYSQLDDARHDRALLRARVNMLYRDRPFHRRTALLMEEEARVSHAAWAQSMDACDQVHSEGISLRTTVMAQQSEIAELQAADRRRQTVISDLLKADHRRQRQLVEALKIVKSLKTQMIELQRQQGPAKDPAEPELPEEASSSS